MEEQLGFYLDLDRCVQCHACEVACKAHKDVEVGITWRRVVGMWAGDYPDLVYRTITYACMHCGEPSCIPACPTGAISKRAEDGVVVVDRETCNGCEACAEACPFGVPQFGQDGTMQMCNLCIDRLAQGKQPACVGPCPSEALRFGTMDVLSSVAAAQPVAGATRPSMLISCAVWSILEPVLPWK